MNKSYGIFTSGGDISDLRTFLDELEAYVGYHITAEEKCMAEHRYPKLNHHSQQHFELKRKISMLVQQSGEIRTDVAVRLFSFELFSFLKDWLVEHILISDRHFGDFITMKRCDAAHPMSENPPPSFLDRF